MTEFTILLGTVTIVIGFILLFADIAHPGLFLLIPAAVLVAVGMLLLIAPDVFYTNMLAAVLVLLAAGAGGAVVALPVYSYLAPRHAPIASTVDTLTGLPAKVTVATQPGTIKGKVRVRGEIWSATSETPIPEGTDVTVTGGEGIILKVSALPPKEGA